jgi:ectoine hydroxylase-related dioxygenase (phytanoyl-CoA dioxygenase family)
LTNQHKKNWYVTWHQDITINVDNRVALEGYSSWTKKQDIFSVCPPEYILQKTFTIRIHLDDTDEKNGALKVLSGSHKKRLNDDEISIITNNSVPNIVEVGAGGIMLMKPLLLHASSKAQNQKRRRVIHLEFTSARLPIELAWLEKEAFFETSV